MVGGGLVVDVVEGGMVGGGLVGVVGNGGNVGKVGNVMSGGSTWASPADISPLITSTAPTAASTPRSRLHRCMPPPPLSVGRP